jgi:hypothetical protein
MREICTSGSVRGGGDNVPTYSAFGVPTRRQIAQECGGLMQVAVRGEEVQLASSEGLFEVVQESAPEHPRQHPDRKEEPWSAGDPAFSIGCDATAGHDHVHMRMVTPTPTIP